MELTYSVMPVSMGNPHCILFCPHPEEIALDVLGPALEHHPVFPDRTNVEFVAVEGDQLRLRVWERGSCETLPAAPGACAALAAAHFLGLCPPEVTALLPGGSLVLSLDTASGHIRMTGPRRHRVRGGVARRLGLTAGQNSAIIVCKFFCKGGVSPWPTSTKTI